MTDIMLSRKVIFLCLAVLPAANAGDWSLSELLNLLAQQEASTASFTETRQSGLLLEDAHLTGRLEYRRPDYLLREIKQPFSERFEVSGSRVTVTGPDRKPASFASGFMSALVRRTRLPSTFADTPLVFSLRPFEPPSNRSWTIGRPWASTVTSRARLRGIPIMRLCASRLRDLSAPSRLKS